MELYDNPFAMRASEKIISDNTFLDLLSPDPLVSLINLNKEDKLWNNVSFIQSVAGGGKTTLLRMFAPEVMKRISVSKHSEFAKQLQTLKVRDSHKVYKCSVYVLARRDYAYIEDEFDHKFEQRGVFFALLNVRIITATIKSLLNLYELPASSLKNIEFKPSIHQNCFKGLEIPCSVYELLNWVSEREEKIYNILSIYRREKIETIMDSSLFSLEAMNPAFFRHDKTHLINEFIFQIDDAHKFTKSQLCFLTEELVERRSNKTIWIASRLEGLTPQQLLDSTDIKDRDYNIIHLDDSKTLSRRYEVMLRNIADKRSKLSKTEINLVNSLDDELLDKDIEIKFKKVAHKLRNQIEAECNLSIFHEWMNWIETLHTWREQAQYYRAFIIFYNREKLHGNETALFPYPSELCKPKLENILQDALTLLSLENKIPVYFGMKDLVSLSTSNVEQFLFYAESLYRYLLAKQVVSPYKNNLSAIDQHNIIVRKSCEKYEEIKNRPNGTNLKNLIDHLVDFSRKQTFSETFSYKYVSGFAIKQENNGEYPEPMWYNSDENFELARVIKDCIAFNLLEMITINQGEQKQQWTVFYLSRWICAAKGLGLQKGGWRKLSLKEIKTWIKK